MEFRLAAIGKSILLISSEMPEVIRLSDMRSWASCRTIINMTR